MTKQMMRDIVQAQLATENIASQRVAHRAGYCPAWVCAYKGKYEGLELMPTC